MTIRAEVMESCLDLLEDILRNAHSRVHQAQEALIAKRNNEAVGCISGMEDSLRTATALFDTILATHRMAVKP